jgi:hypothetical protein
MERLSTLDEFTDDKTVCMSHHAIKDRKKQLWSLSDQIYEAFMNPDNPPLFENTTQNTPEGYSKMEACYENGRIRMQNLLAQEVYSSTKRDRSGRGKKELETDTVSAANQRKRAQKQKGKQRALVQPDDALNPLEVQPMEWSQEQKIPEIIEEHGVGSSTAQSRSNPKGPSVLSVSSARPTKKERKDFSAEEIQALGELTQYKGQLPQTVRDSVAEKLKTYGWTAKKVWDYWYNVSGERKARQYKNKTK